MKDEKMIKELMKKAQEAKSPEELLAIAKENGIDDITEQDAKESFEMLQKSVKLTGDELEKVSAGYQDVLNSCDSYRGKKSLRCCGNCNYFRDGICSLEDSYDVTPKG